MKRFGLLLLAVVMVAGLAGCGGGDDETFDMNGTWLVTVKLVRQVCTWDGYSSVEWRVDQDQSILAITVGNYVRPGMINKDTGTFASNFLYPGDVQSGIVGRMTSNEAFEADEHVFAGNCNADFKLSGELLHR